MLANQNTFCTTECYYLEFILVLSKVIYGKEKSKAFPLHTNTGDVADPVSVHQPTRDLVSGLSLHVVSPRASLSFG